MIVTLRPNTNTRGLALLTAAILASIPDEFVSSTTNPQVRRSLRGLKASWHRHSRCSQSSYLDEVRVWPTQDVLEPWSTRQHGLQFPQEQCMTWDLGQQRWSSLVATDDTSALMEVDRVEGKEWQAPGGKKGKGRSQTKGLQKARQSRKASPRTCSDRSKGKSKGGDRQCYVCGRFGHMAKDCWKNPQQIKSIPQGGQQVQDPRSTSDGCAGLSSFFNNAKLHSPDKRFKSGISVPSSRRSSVRFEEFMPWWWKHLRCSLLHSGRGRCL